MKMTDADHNDAGLILKLYDLRRETVMREARNYMLTTDFSSADAVKALAANFGDPHNAYFRQVVSYWEMAASFVLHGVLSPELFADNCGEGLVVYIKLEPHIQAWKADMPANAEFVRMPAALNRGWQLHARVFYTAEALGVLDEVHEELFREIHGKGNRLDTEESLVEFFGRFGVSEEQFMETFNSFAVQTRLRQSDSLVRRYRITGVPAVVVNGKYVTGADMAGGETRLFEVVNFLVEKESS